MTPEEIAEMMTASPQNTSSPEQTPEKVDNTPFPAHRRVHEASKDVVSTEDILEEIDEESDEKDITENVHNQVTLSAPTWAAVAKSALDHFTHASELKEEPSDIDDISKDDRSDANTKNDVMMMF